MFYNWVMLTVSGGLISETEVRSHLCRTGDFGPMGPV